LLARSAPL
jgi:hypothetical protein